MHFKKNGYWSKVGKQMYVHIIPHKQYNVWCKYCGILTFMFPLQQICWVLPQKMTTFCEFGTSTNDVSHKALELYKSKHPKNQSFVFIHYWFILKDIPKWVDFWKDVKKTTRLKQFTFVEKHACVYIGNYRKVENLEPPMTNGNPSSNRP